MSISVLDCTLRDGGYINEWCFGEDNIKDIISLLSNCLGIDYIELGLLRDKQYEKDSSIYNCVRDAEKLIPNDGRERIKYGVMIEMSNYYNHENLCNYDGGKLCSIRYSFWKRLSDDAYEYCKKIKQKGYELCCQPTRVEQYSDSEFRDACKRFGELEPNAFYIVDTFGLLRGDRMLEYAHIADEELPEGTVLGYHAHDNMGQAFSNTVLFLNEVFSRNIQVDSTIMGMGRGAGNLRTEQLLVYLNDSEDLTIDLDPIWEIWDNNLYQFYCKERWGYSLEYFISAINECNPAYPRRLKKAGMPLKQSLDFINSLEGQDKYLFNNELLCSYISEKKEWPTGHCSEQ